ncbi:ATP-binding cassette domain-containing protein [Novosphingobium sp.]|uniref:ATP-binding cassette domain-containing protein n=1 Tax=Novosphingobium sp. TaxID=1874826 RepID=UPI0025E1CF0A|nr:ATP-binding cassette domain-containing protein [Novosphingobium sp.]
MAEAPLLRLTDVAKRFKGSRRGAPHVQALNGINLILAPGRSLGLVGPDAGGKTTLMRILAGLVEADRGEVEVMGRPVANLDRSLVGYMPQSGALYGELTVRQNLELYARLRGLEPGDSPERMDMLYRATGLSPFTDRAANRLSGGMRQKLALACAVVAAPPLMLLDEPSVGVDPVSRREIWDLALELAGPGSAIVWTTSILDDAGKCDDVILLHSGHILYNGPPEGLAEEARGHTFARPLPPTSRRAFLQEALERPEVISATMSGKSLRAVCRSASPPPGKGWIPITPEAEDGFARMLDDGLPLAPSALAAAFPLRAAQPDRPAIAALQLTRRYGAFTAARDITFTVFPGEIFGLLGPNGAGKSTTFRMLCGLLSPSSGRGTVAGRELSSARAQAREAMGYMPQKFSLYGDLSVLANLRFVAGAYGLIGNKARDAIDRVVNALDLSSFTAQMAGLLPLGIKQRLALGAAVLHTPPVLFLDEPTSGVDPLIRREFWHHINAIAARGTAVLVTTHFMDEAENCDRLLLINRSEAIASGTPDDLKRAVIGKSDPTLEEAFITLIEAQGKGESEAA